MLVVFALILFAASALAKAKQGEPCDADGTCASGLTCVHFRGVAGTHGPLLSSCEIQCGKSECPKGQTCKTIYDGPGQVCRPTVTR
jgi:hypothetical protein